MKALFAQQWPGMQKVFAEKMKRPAFAPTWEAFFESMKIASVRGHRSSATGNHVDIRINWNGRVKRVHLDSKHLESPFIAQYIIGQFLCDMLPSFKSVVVDSMNSVKEWGGANGISVAEFIFNEAAARGIHFCQQLVDYASVLDQATDTARRKHVMEASLRDATPLIRRAISNGCDPQVLIDLINHCIVEDVLEN